MQSRLEVLSDSMLDAVLAAFDAYAALGVPFALVAGSAAGAHGRPPEEPARRERLAQALANSALAEE